MIPPGLGKLWNLRPCYPRRRLNFQAWQILNRSSDRKDPYVRRNGPLRLVRVQTSGIKRGQLPQREGNLGFFVPALSEANQPLLMSHGTLCQALGSRVGSAKPSIPKAQSSDRLDVVAEAKSFVSVPKAIVPELAFPPRFRWGYFLQILTYTDRLFRCLPWLLTMTDRQA